MKGSQNKYKCTKKFNSFQWKLSYVSCSKNGDSILTFFPVFISLLEKLYYKNVCIFVEVQNLRVDMYFFHPSKDLCNLDGHRRKVLFLSRGLILSDS